VNQWTIIDKEMVEISEESSEQHGETSNRAGASTGAGATVAPIGYVV
jgi:hypothetical protein